jgi:hypothetical protein
MYDGVPMTRPACEAPSRRQPRFGCCARIGGADELGYAEVRDLHAASAIEQDVLRLDVSVDDALSWAYWSASQIWGTMARRLARGDPLALGYLARLTPSTYSIKN